MNLLAARVALRPRPLGDLLDLAVPFCLAGRRVVGRLALAVLGPALAVCLLLRLGAHWSWPAVWLAALALADLLQGVFTTAFGELLFAEDGTVRAGAVAGRYRRRLVPMAGALLVTRIAGALLTLLLPLLPVIAVRMLFVREVVLLEGTPALASLGRSRRLVARQTGSCVGLLAALLAAPVAFAIGGELLGDAVVRVVLQLGSPIGQLFRDGGSGYALVGFFLSVPVVTAARFLKYIDVRTREEGWDIQVRFTAIAAAETTAPDQGARSAG
jgi:hypothetical protein